MKDDTDHLRNHFSGLLNNHPVVQHDAKALDLIKVMEGRA